MVPHPHMAENESQMCVHVMFYRKHAGRCEPATRATFSLHGSGAINVDIVPRYHTFILYDVF